MNHIKDLTPDPRNARKHGPRNVGTITDALRKVGFARSIVVDEDNVILAGNATIEAAAEAGLTKLQVVDADGETVVAVRRSGLTPQQKARLALFDNRAAELAEGWDADVLKRLQDDGVSLDGLWGEDELREVLDGPPLPDPQPQTAPELESEVLITIRCTRGALQSMTDTLNDWSTRPDVTIDIS